jgi:citrate lyase subunit beta/citryl-CoA lyase
MPERTRSAAARRLRRAVHFVPGANEKMLTKSLDLAADSLVLDLEDAVTPANKEVARSVVCDWLRDVDFGRQERVVRPNPLDTPWGAEDLRATMAVPPDAYLIPKVNTLVDVEAVDAELTRLEGEYSHAPDSVSLLLVATETPAGVLNQASFPQCQRVAGMTWGAEDLSAAIGARRARASDGAYLDVFKHCRVQTLLACTAGDVQPIASVFVEIKELDRLRAECREDAWMGFTGKITIHPDQIPIVNEAFTPSREELEEAQELLAAFHEAEAVGRMVFSFKGQMVDVPHLRRAERIVERARGARAGD